LTLSYALLTRGKVQFAVRLSIETENQLISVERMIYFQASVPAAEGAKAPTTAPGLHWPEQGALIFRNVVLRYRPDLPLALCGASLEVASGSWLSICGRTGSGKSTMLGALLRLCSPLDSGVILLDGIDVLSVPLEELRGAVAVVPQDALMWCGTVAENLCPGRTSSDERLWSMLEALTVAPAVLAAGGLGADVRSRGGIWSVGERQLLCLARCLLRAEAMRVICVDEAAASVDAGTDEIVRAALRQHAKGRTMLAVAHHRAMLLESDLVAVMDQGVVIETGEPAVLCADSSSHFGALMRLND